MGFPTPRAVGHLFEVQSASQLVGDGAGGTQVGVAPGENETPRPTMHHCLQLGIIQQLSVWGQEGKMELSYQNIRRECHGEWRVSRRVG